MHLPLVLAAGLIFQCPGGYCPPGVCLPCGDVVYESAMPVRFVSSHSGICQSTSYGSNGDVVAQLAAQQDRLIRSVQALSEDVATIRWQFARPISQSSPYAYQASPPTPSPYATPLPVPDKQMPQSREIYPTPQASPQIPQSREVPRKALPVPPVPSTMSTPPQAWDAPDAALQWQRALQAHRVKFQGTEGPSRVFGEAGPNRTPFSLDR